MRIPLLFASALVAVLSVAAAIPQLMDLGDPCVQWGMSGGTATLQPGGACPDRVEGRSETRSEAAARLLVVNGLAIACGILGTWGALGARPAPLQAASAFMFALSIPLLIGAFGAFAVWVACAFLLGAHWLSVAPHQRLINRGLAIVAGIGAIFFMVSAGTAMLGGAVLFFVFQLLTLVPLAGAATIVFWPGQGAIRSQT